MQRALIGVEGAVGQNLAEMDRPESTSAVKIGPHGPYKSFPGIRGEYGKSVWGFPPPGNR